jgi:chitinase
MFGVRLVQRSERVSRPWIVPIVWLCCCSTFFAEAAAQKPVVVAYVSPRDSLIQPGEIAAQKLTRINYAFANLQSGRVASAYSNDDRNLAQLVALKKQNPSLTVLVSVGGWLGSGGFSDMALTRESRTVFIASAMEFVSQHNVDGLDIDWEYPGVPGATNNFRPEDQQNYTLLLKETRESLNQLGKKVHRLFYLTIAAGANPDFLAHTEMIKVQNYVDTVNLMAYDYYQADTTTGHHAPLFTNPADPKKVSADRSVREFEQAGVPAAKIVLGVPFYSRAWSDVSGTNNGLFQQGKAIPGGVDAGGGAEAMMKNGFIRSWDPVASAPYLYNPQSKVFVSYDDSESIAAKCKYVVDHGLGGVMFWDYESDPTGVLLDAVDVGLGISAGTQNSPK